MNLFHHKTCKRCGVDMWQKTRKHCVDCLSSKFSLYKRMVQVIADRKAARSTILQMTRLGRVKHGVKLLEGKS